MDKKKQKSSLSWLIDKEEEFLQRIIPPIKLEFNLKDLFQVIVGATILAVPVGFTQEVWDLGSSLPMLNIFGIFALSLIFISSFVYYHYYRGRAKYHFSQFTKRIFFTYFFSFIVVGIILYLIQIAPWQTNLLLAIKRTVLVTLPASMSATVADTLK